MIFRPDWARNMTFNCFGIKTFRSTVTGAHVKSGSCFAWRKKTLFSSLAQPGAHAAHSDSSIIQLTNLWSVKMQASFPSLHLGSLLEHRVMRETKFCQSSEQPTQVHFLVLADRLVIIDHWQQIWMNFNWKSWKMVSAESRVIYDMISLWFRGRPLQHWAHVYRAWREKCKQCSE